MSDEQRALITAAVDGELSAAETARFRRLLDNSAEARSLYVRLKHDSTRLAHLPTVSPPDDLPQKVMARVVAITPTPGPLPLSTRATKRGAVPSPTNTPIVIPIGIPLSRSRRSWVPAAVAASLMLGVMGGSFWYFTRDRGQAERLARSADRPPPATQLGAGDPEWANWLPAEHGPRPVAPTPTPAASRPETRLAQSSPIPDQEIAVAVEPATTIAPSPRPGYNPGVLASELRSEISPLDLVQVRVPLLRPLAEFDRDDVRRDFTAELGKDPAFRIDVFTRNLPRSVDWVRAAAKASGVTLNIDTITAERVARGQASAFVVYTESLTPAEVTELFGRLAAEDSRVSPRTFDLVHAAPVVADDQKAIRGILGTDPGLFKRPKQEKVDKVQDVSKPLSAGTADQIVKSLTTGKPLEKSAVLMTWLPGVSRTPPLESRELKQFLAKRGDRKPTAVPVLIVVRYREG